MVYFVSLLGGLVVIWLLAAYIAYLQSGDAFDSFWDALKSLVSKEG
jgi:hypothetical protein